MGGELNQDLSIWSRTVDQFIATAVYCIILLYVFGAKCWILRPSCRFLGAFVELWKATISFVMSVCPSVLLSFSMEQLGSHWTDFNKTWYFSFFWNSIYKIQVSLKSHKNKGTLYEHVFTFLTISRWIIIRMRNSSDKSSRKNQNTHLTLNNFSPKIAPFMR